MTFLIVSFFDYSVALSTVIMPVVSCAHTTLANVTSSIYPIAGMRALNRMRVAKFPNNDHPLSIVSSRLCISIRAVSCRHRHSVVDSTEASA
jgi:hypothetical protein